MRKAVITGANGFLGSSLASKLVQDGICVVAIDLPGLNAHLPSAPNLTFIGNDLSDFSTLAKEELVRGADVLYHFAWEGSAGPKRADPTIQFKNALISGKIVDFAHSMGIKKVIVAGSVAELETDQATKDPRISIPTSYSYGMGKAAAHTLAKIRAQALGVDLCWVYITNIFGIGEKSPRLINSSIRKIIAGEELKFSEATNNYDFIYIDDAIGAFVAIGERGVKNAVYPLGSGEPKPLKEFLLEIVDELSFKGPVTFGAMPTNGVNLQLSDLSGEPLRSIGFKPSLSFREGIRKTYEWIKESN